VKIAFANDDVLGLCTNEKLARKKLGEAGFRRLRTRLAELEAARCVTELPAGRPHPLFGDRLGQYAVSLDGARIVGERIE
jgi:proteic killer suppression protein